MKDNTIKREKNSYGLLIKVLAAMAIGISLGYVMPMSLARGFMTFNAIFNQFLGFLIPLIIVGFVMPAIGEVGSKAGKVLVVTVLIAYASTVISGILAYLTATATFPSLIDPGALAHDTSSAEDIAPYFTIQMPPVFDVMTALVLAFLLGIGIAYGKSDILFKGAVEFREIVQKAIKYVIIPLLPIYIFGIFMNMTIVGQVGTVLLAFAKIIGIIFAMAAFILILQYTIAAIFVRRNPFRLLFTMLPAYFTALGTQSSAATIPVTLRQAIKTGVSEEIAGFVIPLCATIHMSGSTLKIVMCAVALMMMHGLPYSLPMFVGFVAMLAITMVAAPGVPGGAIMAALGLLSSMLGFSQQDIALMIALYIAMDSFGTACNVTGDGSIALIVDHFFGRKGSPDRDPMEGSPAMATVEAEEDSI